MLFNIFITHTFLLLKIIKKKKINLLLNTLSNTINKCIIIKNNYIMINYQLNIYWVIKWNRKETNWNEKNEKKKRKNSKDYNKIYKKYDVKKN